MVVLAIDEGRQCIGKISRIHRKRSGTPYKQNVIRLQIAALRYSNARVLTMSFDARIARS